MTNLDEMTKEQLIEEISNLNQKIEKLNEKVDSLEEEVDDLEDDIYTKDEEIDKLETYKRKNEFLLDFIHTIKEEAGVDFHRRMSVGYLQSLIDCLKKFAYDNPQH